MSPQSPNAAHDIEKALGPIDQARYENARWWRNINRFLSVIGGGIIIAIVSCFPSCRFDPALTIHTDRPGCRCITIALIEYLIRRRPTLHDPLNTPRHYINDQFALQHFIIISTHIRTILLRFLQLTSMTFTLLRLVYSHHDLYTPFLATSRYCHVPFTFRKTPPSRLGCHEHAVRLYFVLVSEKAGIWIYSLIYIELDGAMMLGL